MKTIKSIIKTLFFKILVSLFIIIICLEVFLRLIGFGNPILYINETNYYPKSNQEIRRFKGSKFLTNNYGMRTNYKWNNVEQNYKILFFGDSVTFGGSYINNKDLFSEKFCQKVKNSVCGNYGVNGYKINNLNLRIKNISKKINFDHLIIVVSSSIQLGHSNFYEFPFYEKFDYKIFKSSFEILNHILFKYNIKNNYHTSKNSSNKVSKYNLDEFIKSLNKLNKKINIFILPTLEDLNGNLNKKHFLEDVKNINFNIYNAYDEIKNLNYFDLYFNNAHLNKKGHEYFSKMIYDKINEF